MQINISKTLFLSLILSLQTISAKIPEGAKEKKTPIVKKNNELKKSSEDLSDKDDLGDILKDLFEEKDDNPKGKSKNILTLLKELEELEKEEKRLKEEAKAKKKLESENASSKAFSIADPSQIKETLNSVILNEKAQKQLNMVIKFFKEPQIFSEIGAERPRGILLEGPPGTGKTSIGRALAKEAGCKFFYANGSDFDAKFVGEGAKAIGELFKVARENSPSIIFIDEIDTIAKKRTGEESRFHSQTLTKFLTELDGFLQSDDSVVVIATTNKRDHMDEAVLRFGRFGIEVKIDNPDQESRKRILSLYISKIKLSDKVHQYEVNELAAKAEGFSGADLKKVVQQSALNAIMDNRKTVEYKDLEAVYKQIKEEKKRAKKANRKNQIPDYVQNAMLSNDSFV